MERGPTAASLGPTRHSRSLSASRGQHGPAWPGGDSAQGWATWVHRGWGATSARVPLLPPPFRSHPPPPSHPARDGSGRLPAEAIRGLSHRPSAVPSALHPSLSAHSIFTALPMEKLRLTLEFRLRRLPSKLVLLLC